MSVAPAPPRPDRRTGVTYDEYVRLRDDPGFHGTRMAYLDGVLELMSPEFRHERGGEPGRRRRPGLLRGVRRRLRGGRVHDLSQGRAGHANGRGE